MSASVMCALSGKKSFRSPNEAEKRRKVLKRTRDDRLSVYRCRCGAWHLGHASGDKRVRRP